MIASTARRVAAKLRGSSLPRSSLNFLRRELERLQEKFKKRSERIAELEKQVQEKEKELADADRKSTRLNSSHGYISYAVFCLKKKNKTRPKRSDWQSDSILRRDTLCPQPKPAVHSIATAP